MYKCTVLVSSAAAPVNQFVKSEEAVKKYFKFDMSNKVIKSYQKKKEAGMSVFYDTDQHLGNNLLPGRTFLYSETKTDFQCQPKIHIL